MMPVMTGEFDQVNRISLLRVAGRLVDESLAGLYEESHKYSTDTDASVSIVDLSSVTDFALSCESVRHLAERKLVSGDGSRPCIIVAPEGHAYGLCRMFQTLCEVTRPLLYVVHTLGEAVAAIGIPSPRFAPLVFGSVSPVPLIA